MLDSGFVRQARGRTRVLRARGRRAVLGLWRAETPPEVIAGGIAVGVACAMLPFPFAQFALAVFLAWAFGASKLAAGLFVWVANPLFFYADYVVGRALLRLAAPQTWGGAGMSWEGFVTHWRESAWALIREVILPMTLGGVILGAAVGAVTYALALRSLLSYRARRAAARSEHTTV